VQRCRNIAVLTANEYWHLWSERAGGDALGGGELKHVGDANTVFGGPALNLLADVREALVFGASAFIGEYEAAVAAIVDAVVEGRADGLVGICSAAGKVCLEFCGDLSPDCRATGGARPDVEGKG